MVSLYLVYYVHIFIIYSETFHSRMTDIFPQDDERSWCAQLFKALEKNFKDLAKARGGSCKKLVLAFRGHSLKASGQHDARHQLCQRILGFHNAASVSRLSLNIKPSTVFVESPRSLTAAETELLESKPLWVRVVN
jgi:hypothetical protein